MNYSECLFVVTITVSDLVLRKETPTVVGKKAPLRDDFWDDIYKKCPIGHDLEYFYIQTYHYMTYDHFDDLRRC